MVEHGALDAVLRKAGLPTQSESSEGLAGGGNPPSASGLGQVAPTGAATLPPTLEGPAAAAAASPSSSPELPPMTNPTEVIELFNRQHGRSPTLPETRAIRLVPILTAQLGRRPLRAELLAALDSRNETQPNEPAQFREVGPAQTGSDAEAQGGPGPAIQPG